MSGSQYAEHNGQSGMVVHQATSPQRVGQATMVEQARAIAEVRAAVMIARENPRDRSAAITEMREVCAIQGLAERAFFRVRRGGEMVNGESIHLARELARCWGNITYGVKEMSRDDMLGQSELLAFAWDLETNDRSEVVFIVPHVRGNGEKRRVLTGTQEIYENNASFAGRRLRETIFAVLPVWFKAEASDICHRTLESGGGKPLVQCIADLRTAFEAMGVTAAMLEKKRGRKMDDFTPEDVAALRVVYGSLKREEVTVAEEFPSVEIPPTKPTGGKLAVIEKAAKEEHAASASAPPPTRKATAPTAAGMSADCTWLLENIRRTKPSEVALLMKTKAVTKMLAGLSSDELAVVEAEASERSHPTAATSPVDDDGLPTDVMPG